MGAVLKAFDEGVKASQSLDLKVDAALIATGRELANQIDFAIENLEGSDVTKALYLTPHLVNILKEMGATPAVRAAIAATPAAESGKKKPGGLASVSNIPRPA